MTLKQSLAQKRIWKGRSKEERSKIMSKLGKISASKKSKRQLSLHGKMMVEARINQNKK